MPCLLPCNDLIIAVFKEVVFNSYEKLWVKK